MIAQKNITWIFKILNNAFFKKNTMKTPKLFPNNTIKTSILYHYYKWKLKDTQNRNISWDDIWIFQFISYTHHEEQYSTKPNVKILIDYQAQSQYIFFIGAYESS